MTEITMIFMNSEANYILYIRNTSDRMTLPYSKVDSKFELPSAKHIIVRGYFMIHY